MEFIRKIQRTITTNNDEELSKLLIIKWGFITSGQVEISKSARALSGQSFMGNFWGIIIENYISCLKELDFSSSDDSYRNYIGACDAANAALKCILDNNPEYYRLTVRSLINNAQNIAYKAKEYSKSDDKVDTPLKNILHILEPKVNALLKDYEKNNINQNRLALTLCNAYITIASILKINPIIQSTLMSVKPLIESKQTLLPISDVVSFNYFKGTSDITNEINEKYKCLKFSFDHCLKGSSNKRVILRSLIATAIVTKQDVYPSPKLLEKYNLTDAYSGIIHSIKFGNPVLFDRELDRNIAIFSKWGHYFTIVKARFKLWRNICRFAQNFIIKKNINNGRNDVVHFELIKKVVGVTTKGEYVPDDDEIECIFANTISMKYMNASLFIKGTTKVLLLDPSDPFYLNKK